MTTFEHAMIGVNGALAAGLDKRYGWPIVAWAGLAAISPDWDGLTILFGIHAYDKGHRIWGHNLLIATLLAAFAAYLLHRFDILRKFRLRLARRWPIFNASLSSNPPTDLAITALDDSQGGTFLWIVVGVIAAYSHLLADVVFSVGNKLSVWGIPLFWPFSSREWAYPLIRWGDIGATLILAASMFVMVYFPKRTRIIAAGSLALVVFYALVRGLMFS